MAITKNLVNIGNADISGDLTAATLKKRNGTNKQILLADGTTKDMGTSTTTFLRNDGTWATVSSGTDEKQTVTATTSGTFYLSGVGTTSATPTVGVADATVKVANRVLTVTSASITNATVSTATISTANITTINGVTVGNSPKFTDTNTTYSVTTAGSGNALTTIGLSGTTITATLGATFATSGHNHDNTYSTLGHSHGNITNDGSITVSVDAEDGNKLVIVDNNGKITAFADAFSTATTFLRRNGTWATPTNTRNTAGATVSNSRLYLVCATSTGGSYKVTYSNASVWSEAGFLYSNKTKVSVEGHTHSEYSTTDEKVKQEVGTGDMAFPVLTAPTTISTGTQTTSSYYQPTLRVNPNYGSIMIGGGDGIIIATGTNSIAGGYALVDATISAVNSGSIAFGHANTNASIYANGRGAYAGGGVTGGPSYICAIGNGAWAHGAAWLNNPIEANGNGSHAEGASTKAIGNGAHAEGCNTIASATASHAEGYLTTASGTASHAEGNETKSLGPSAHSEGAYTNALGDNTHAEGRGLTSSLGNVTAKVSATQYTLSGITVTIEGSTYTLQVGDIVTYNSKYAKVTAISGNTITINQTLSAAVGNTIYLIKGVSYGARAHSEGYLTAAINNQDHAEGYLSMTLGGCAHAEGERTIAEAWCSHAEGRNTIAKGSDAHAEGWKTNASGADSHAEGYETEASATASHAGGVGTIANVLQVTAIGRYNSICSNGDLFVIGNGASTASLKTIFKVSDSNGSIYGGGNAIVTVTGKVNANEGFFQTSDERQKNIISDLSLEKVYDLIDKCQTIIYTLKDDESNKEQIGMIAQEIQEFFPEVISEDKDGMLSLDYSRLTVIIFKVLKDLIKRIGKIEQKLN